MGNIQRAFMLMALLGNAAMANTPEVRMSEKPVNCIHFLAQSKANATVDYVFTNPTVVAQGNSKATARKRHDEQMANIRKVLTEAGVSEKDIVLDGEFVESHSAPELNPEPGKEFRAYQSYNIHVPAEANLGEWVDKLFAQHAEFEYLLEYRASEKHQAEAAAQARKISTRILEGRAADYREVLAPKLALGKLQTEESVDYNTLYHTQPTQAAKGSVHIPLGGSDASVTLDGYLPLPPGDPKVKAKTLTVNHLVSQPAQWKEVQGSYSQKDKSLATILTQEQKALTTIITQLQALDIALSDIDLDTRSLHLSRPEPVFLPGQQSALTPDPVGFESSRTLRVRVRDNSKIAQVKAILEKNLGNASEYFWGIDDEESLRSQARKAALQEVLKKVQAKAKTAKWQITQIKEVGFYDAVYEPQKTDTDGNALEGRASTGVSLTVLYQVL